MMIDQVDIYSRQVEGEAVREDQEKSGRVTGEGGYVCHVSNHKAQSPSTAVIERRERGNMMS